MGTFASLEDPIGISSKLTALAGLIVASSVIGSAVEAVGFALFANLAGGFFAGFVG
jgi:hypothetical protein